MSDVEEPSKTLLEPEAGDSLNDANAPEIGSGAARAAEGPNVDLIASGSPVWRGYLRALGPGLITGCADDDPSGISTYSVTGATFGYGLLWTALLTFPMMTAVQLMCGRLGMVTPLERLQRPSETATPHERIADLA